MPIYEYECRDCGHRFEALQKISDAPRTDCPACGKASVSKLVSASAFRLKGGGWYETDFKTGNRRHGTQESGSGGADKGSDTSSKADKAGKTGDNKPAA
ncbi:MAG: zinc ribbon domain-containing protein [Pseudohongiellaceae bacterium]